MSPQGGEPLPVFVYFDYVCPFSYVGRARLGLLAEERPLDVTWRPFEIHPGVPPGGRPVRELGVPPDEWTSMERAVEEMARELDLPFSLPDVVASSGEALQAAEFARDVSLDTFRRLHDRLFRAYFAGGRNLGRREELLEIAAGAGVDREALRGALEDGRYESELRRAREEAERYDVTGTPTFLFGRFKVVGAAPLPVLREAAARAAGEEDGGGEAHDGTEREGGSG